MGNSIQSCIASEYQSKDQETQSTTYQNEIISPTLQQIDIRNSFSSCKQNILQRFIFPIEIDGPEGEKCEFQEIINKECDKIESINLQQIQMQCINTNNQEKVLIKFQNGGIYKGETLGNYMHGYGRLETKQLIYEGTWSFNSMHGFGWLIVFEENQEMENNEIYYEYIGEFDHNLKQGNGTQSWQNGKKYIGEWKNGQMIGQGLMYGQNSFDYVIYQNGFPKQLNSIEQLNN